MIRFLTRKSVLLVITCALAFAVVLGAWDGDTVHDAPRSEGQINRMIAWGTVLGLMGIAGLGTVFIRALRQPINEVTQLHTWTLNVPNKKLNTEIQSLEQIAELQAMAETVDKETRAAVGQIASLTHSMVYVGPHGPNRRSEPRYHLDRIATVRACGSVYRVVIENISAGGIKGRGLPNTIPAGSHIEVVIDGSKIILSTIALMVDQGAVHGQFKLTPDSLGRWSEDFARLVQDLTPLKEFA